LHPPGTLARAGVGLRVLTANRQAAPVAYPAVAADLCQALDVLRALAPQIALDRELLVDRVAELADLLLGEVADVGVRGDLGRIEQLVGRRPSNSVDVGEADLDPLVEREVDARDSCPGRYPCRCLCRGFVQITSTTPWRRTILHFSHVGLTDGPT